MPCKDLPNVNIGETGRALEEKKGKRKNKHKRDRYARESNAFFKLTL